MENERYYIEGENNNFQNISVSKIVYVPLITSLSKHLIEEIEKCKKRSFGKTWPLKSNMKFCVTLLNRADSKMMT